MTESDRLPALAYLGASDFQIGAPDSSYVLPGFIDVAEYRTDNNRPSWAWRCWGNGDCDGHLHLGCGTEQYARRRATQHVADHHPEISGSSR